MHKRVACLVASTVFIALTHVASAIAQESPPQLEKAKEVSALVDKAATLVNAKGKAGFGEMKQNPGNWRKGDVYLLACDMNGKALFNMGFPRFEGTDASGLADSTGKLIVKEQIEVAQTKGSGWVNYMWPKAGQTEPRRKWTYVKAVRIDGTAAYVAAGFYPDN
jgi:signal transduction histidine kinase